jgi:hypothetical protein
MSEFVDAFVNAASAVVAKCPGGSYEWVGDASKPPLTLIVKAAPGGFPVELKCQSYGVYPSAAGWHGAPWDVTVHLPKDVAAAITEFLESVLSLNARLEVHRANGKAYKYVLHYRFNGQQVTDTTGLFFYNWFAQRSVTEFSNNWLSLK